MVLRWRRGCETTRIWAKMPGGDSAAGESGCTSNDAGSSGGSVMVSVDVGSLVLLDPKGNSRGIS